MLTKENIDRIKNYHYSSIDSSIFGNYLDVLCNIIVKYVPITISPNIISIIGLTHVITGTILLSLLVSPIKYLLCAILLFVYQLCDTLDGKQGKRTNMYYNSSTELYDHGVDSIVMSLSLINFSMVLPLSHTWRCFAFFAAASTFYLPTWEHVHVRVMDFRFALFNPTEALLCTELMYIGIWLDPNIVNTNFPKYVITAQLFGVFWLYFSCLKKTFSVHKKISNEQIITILPLFVTSILMFYHTNMSDYIEILLLWNHAVVSLIWKEISGTKYEFNYFVLAVLRYHFAPNLYLAIVSYILLFARYSRLICDVYGMKHFWTILNK